MIERGSHSSAKRYISYLLGNRTYLKVELDVPGRVSQARAARSRFGQARGGEKISGKVRGLHEILSPPIITNPPNSQSNQETGHPRHSDTQHESDDDSSKEVDIPLPLFYHAPSIKYVSNEINPHPIFDKNNKHMLCMYSR